MTEPSTQDPAQDQKIPLTGEPIDFGTPVQAQPATQSASGERSLSDLITGREPEPPTDWTGSLKDWAMVIPRGIANAGAGAWNLLGTLTEPVHDEFYDPLHKGVGQPSPFVPERPLGRSEAIVPGFAEGITQFAAGFAVGGPLVKGVGLGVKGAGLLAGAGRGAALARAAVTGSGTSFVVFDGHSGRFADLVAMIPGLDEPMREYLGATLTSEDDSEIVGRLKNTIEGAGLGVATHYLLLGAKGIRAGMRAKAEGKAPEAVIAAVETAAPVAEIQKAFDDVVDMRTAEQSPFKGALLDDAILKAKTEPVFVNVDGSEAMFPAGFEKQLVNEPVDKIITPTAEIPIRVRAEVEADLAKNFADAEDVLRRRLKYDDAQVAAYIDNVRKASDFSNPEQAAAESAVKGVHAKLKVRDRTRLEAETPTGLRTARLIQELKASGSERGVREAQRIGSTTATMQVDPAVRYTIPPRFVTLAKFKSASEFPAKEELQSWVNQHGTLLDNPQTTIKLNPDGTAEIGVSLNRDQWTPTAEKLAASVTKDMTPTELGATARDLTSAPRVSRPVEPPSKPPAAGGEPQALGIGDTGPGYVPPVNTPHQVYLGQIGFDNKAADEIGRILGGEFEEGIAHRGEINLKFKATGDAVNPKHMSRAELLHRELKQKGLNLEGLKGQPEQLAQAMRVLEKMNDALREAENPLLIKESYAEMNARVAVERDTMLGIPTATDLSTYIKLNEKAGVEAANKIGAQARASIDIAAGIIDDVRLKSAEYVKREASGGIVDEIEWADLAENRNLAKDAADMGINLKNALARNLYAQRGKITPSNNVTRYTSAQIRANPELRAQILMDNGGVKGMREFAEAAAKIDAAGGLDLSKIAALLKLSRESAGGMGIIQEAWFASILSSLGTPMAQMTGNIGTAMYQPFARAFAMGVHIPFAKTPELAALYKSEFAKAVGTYTSNFAALPEALKAYKYGFLEGRKLTPGRGVWDVQSRARPSGIGGDTFGLKGTAGKWADGFGYMVSVFGGRMLRAGDESTRVLVYRSNARSHLLRMGIEKGKTGADLGVYVQESMDKLIHDGQALGVDQLERRALKQVQAQGYTGPHAREKVSRLVNEWQNSDWYKELSPLSEFAIAQAEEASMSKGLRPDTISGGFNQVVNRHPGMKFVTPFIPTSVNIASFGMQHLDFPHAAKWVLSGNSRVAKLLNMDRSKYAEGANRFLADMGSGDPIRQASARGRIILGSTAATGIAGLYMAGMVTGSGPSDAGQRQKMYDDDGWLPYSFNINGKYYSYRRLDPLATVIGTIADIAQATHLAPDDQQADLTELGKGVVVSLANNLTNKTYLRGLSEFVEVLVSPQDNFERWIKSQASTLVPNIVRDAANAYDDLAGSDPAQREIRSVFDAWKAKLPWLSTTLEPRRNVLGEPIKRTEKLGPDWLSIVQTGESSGNALNHELAALEFTLGRPDAMRGDIDMLEIKSATGQTAYDRWLENTGTIKDGGLTLRQRLEQTVASDAYKQMQADSMNGDPSERASELNFVIQRYRRKAYKKTQVEIKALNQAEIDAANARRRGLLIRQ